MYRRAPSGSEEADRIRALAYARVQELLRAIDEQLRYES
jgi:hypothetical protein